MEVVIMVAQLLLALTILVGIHEWGHMFSAKRFGMRVDKFSIGMPPKVYGKKIGETEYSIGALPLGGFVSIAGMVDESMNTEELKEEPKPWEFRSKPAWQRLIVMLGGIIVNTIAGILLFIMVTYVYGESYLPMSEAKYGIVAGEAAKGIGLQTGDKILTVNGKSIDDFEEVMNFDVLLGDDAYYEIDRNGTKMRIDVPVDMINRLNNGRSKFIAARYPFEVGKVQKKSNADKGGLKEGDVILSVNNNGATYFHDFQAALQNNKEKTISVIVNRDNAKIALEIEVSKDATIGFIPIPQIDYKERFFSFGESIPIGTKKAFGIFTSSYMALKKVIKRDADVGKTFNSPIAFAQAFGGTWVWQRFWTMTAMISMALAFMNLLPIPALDGGHVMFLLYEITTGKKPSDKFLEYAQMVGMAILLTLMVYLFGKDIWNLTPWSK